MIIRISDNGISFSAPSQGVAGAVAYENYPNQPGVSVAVNLRHALADGVAERMSAAEALVMVDTPVLLLPIEEFEADETEPLYRHAFHPLPNSRIAHSVLPNLNTVAAFAVDGDIANVVAGKFGAHSFMPLMQPVWKFMHKRSFTGSRASLFTYFHDNLAEVMSFRQNRFRFYNRFDARYCKDAVFYILYVWKQLGMEPGRDNLYVAGAPKDEDNVMEGLRQYVKNVRRMNILADLPRAQSLNNAGLPPDLQIFYTLGR